MANNEKSPATSHLISMTPAGYELWRFMVLESPAQLAQDLDHVHDLALYYSNVEFDRQDKDALFVTKQMIRHLRKVRNLE